MSPGHLAAFLRLWSPGSSHVLPTSPCESEPSFVVSAHSGSVEEPLGGDVPVPMRTEPCVSDGDHGVALNRGVSHVPGWNAGRRVLRIDEI